MAIQGSVALVLFVVFALLMLIGVVILGVVAALAYFQYQEKAEVDVGDNVSRTNTFHLENRQVHHAFHMNAQREHAFQPPVLHMCSRDFSLNADSPPSFNLPAPLTPRSRVIEIEDLSPIQDKSPAEPRNRARPTEVLKKRCSQITVADKQELQRGYAKELASRFGNSIAFHTDNVVTIVNAYGLDADDICYCFLCLERVKRTKRGDYSARVWTVVLARFVFHAQGMQNATDTDHLKLPCREWQYQHNDFVNEVAKVENALSQKHGGLLWSAFHQDAVREAELARARVALGGAKYAEAFDSKVSTRSAKKPLALEDSLTAGAARKKSRKD